MQGRLKFRLYDKTIGEMVYDVCIGFIKDSGKTDDWVCADTSCGQITYRDGKLKDIVLMQCTGLTDKNGKLIYEGDRVYIDYEDETAIIKWSDDLARFTIHFEDEAVFADFDNYYNKELEVIGNIYENSELPKE